MPGAAPARLRRRSRRGEHTALAPAIGTATYRHETRLPNPAVAIGAATARCSNAIPGQKIRIRAGRPLRQRAVRYDSAPGAPVRDHGVAGLDRSYRLSLSSRSGSPRRHAKPRGEGGRRSPRTALTLRPVTEPKTFTSWYSPGSGAGSPGSCSGPRAMASSRPPALRHTSLTATDLHQACRVFLPRKFSLRTLERDAGKPHPMHSANDRVMTHHRE